jgi:hypothetical protein
MLGPSVFLLRLGVVTSLRPHGVRPGHLSLESSVLSPPRQGRQSEGAFFAQSLNRSIGSGEIFEINVFTADFERRDDLDDLEKPNCLFAKQKTCDTEVPHVF